MKSNKYILLLLILILTINCQDQSGSPSPEDPTKPGEEENEQEAEKCNQHCQKCSKAVENGCEECLEDLNRHVVNGVCVCEDGFFENNLFYCESDSDNGFVFYLFLCILTGVICCVIYNCMGKYNPLNICGLFPSKHQKIKFEPIYPEKKMEQITPQPQPALDEESKQSQVEIQTEEKIPSPIPTPTPQPEEKVITEENTPQILEEMSQKEKKQVVDQDESIAFSEKEDVSFPSPDISPPKSPQKRDSPKKIVQEKLPPIPEKPLPKPDPEYIHPDVYLGNNKGNYKSYMQQKMAVKKRKEQEKLQSNSHESESQQSVTSQHLPPITPHQDIQSNTQLQVGLINEAQNHIEQEKKEQKVIDDILKDQALNDIVKENPEE